MLLLLLLLLLKYPSSVVQLLGDLFMHNLTSRPGFATD